MFKNYELKKQNETLKEQITSLNYRISELQDREHYYLERITGFKDAIKFKNEVAEELIQDNKLLQQEKEENEQRALHLSICIKIIEDLVKKHDEKLFESIKKVLNARNQTAR